MVARLYACLNIIRRFSKVQCLPLGLGWVFFPSPEGEGLGFKVGKSVSSVVKLPSTSVALG